MLKMKHLLSVSTLLKLVHPVVSFVKVEIYGRPVIYSLSEVPLIVKPSKEKDDKCDYVKTLHGVCVSDTTNKFFKCHDVRVHIPTY